MDEKQLATRLRDILNTSTEDVDYELQQLVNELDPPGPEPGTVVWFTFSDDDPDPPEPGIVSLSGLYVIDADGSCHPIGTVRIKPAHILGPRQIAVDIPPVKEWPEDVTWIAVDWVSADGHVRTMQELIHREEAARMEASNE